MPYTPLCCDLRSDLDYSGSQLSPISRVKYCLNIIIPTNPLQLNLITTKAWDLEKRDLNMNFEEFHFAQAAVTSRILEGMGWLRGEVVNSAGNLTTMSSAKLQISNGTNHHHILGFSLGGCAMRLFNVHPLYDTMMMLVR
jgi:hypothetical protein